MKTLWRWKGPVAVGAFAGFIILIIFGPSSQIAAGVVCIVVMIGLSIATWRAEHSD
jgi:predicted membrane metal-binding protein